MSLARTSPASKRLHQRPNVLCHCSGSTPSSSKTRWARRMAPLAATSVSSRSSTRARTMGRSVGRPPVQHAGVQEPYATGRYSPGMHRRRRCLAPLWLATMAGLSALACGLPLRSEPEPSKAAQNQSEFKPLDFRMRYTFATGSLMDLDADEFVAETARLTSGAVTGKLLRNGAQASQQELVERVQLGELEVAVSSSALMGAAPEFGVFELPYAFQNRDEVKRAVDGPLGQELA